MRRLVGILIVAVLGVAGCSTGSSGEDAADDRAAEVEELTGTIPVLPKAISGRGTVLGQGFVVEEGSALVGVPFPKEYDTAPDGSEVTDLGFSALLLLTDDLDAVMDRYRDRASTLGLDLGSGSNDEDCALDDDIVTCTVFRSQGVPGHERWLSMVATQGPSTEARPAQSHLFIEYSQIGQQPFPSSDAPAQGGREIEASSSVPDAWGQLVELGDIDVAGAELAAPAQHVPDGAHSVFVVDGDPEDALGAALATSRLEAPQVGELRRWSDGGYEMALLFWSDGHSWVVTTASRPGSPTFMLVDHIDAD